MQGNGHRPKSAKVPPREQEQPQSDAADEKERQPAPATSPEPDDTLNQQYKELKLVRENSDQKFGSDILAAAIIIFVLVVCSLAAYFIWAYALSRPAHNTTPPPMNIILPR